MSNRRKQFFYPTQTSWPVIGLATGEGVGAPAGFGYLLVAGKRLAVSGKRLMVRHANG